MLLVNLLDQQSVEAFLRILVSALDQMLDARTLGIPFSNFRTMLFSLVKALLLNFEPLGVDIEHVTHLLCVYFLDKS